MKINVIFALSLVVISAFSTVDAAAAAKTTAKAPAKTTTKAAAKAAASSPAVATNTAKPASTTGNSTTGDNGEGLPNGSPSDTGCIDGCNVYPPPAPDGNTANSLEIYHLSWFPSFKAGQLMNMSFWTTYNPSTDAGAVPTTINIDLYDQYGKINLASIAQNVAVKTPGSNTEFVLNAWPIPNSVNANFSVGNQFVIVFTGANNWRRDRLLEIDGITASPGGGPNPAVSNAVTGVTSPGNSTSAAAGPSAGGSTTTQASTTAASAAVGLRSDLWMVVCLWTFLVAQVAGFVLL